MVPKRPSALEVTDGFEEDDKAKAAPPPLLHAMPVLTKLVPSREATVSKKRKSTGFNTGDARPSKQSRQKLPAGARFSAKEASIRESDLKFIIGEDVGPSQSDTDLVRLLTNFTIYDPRFQNSLVDLSTVDEEFGNGRIPYVVVGQVLADIQDDEEVDLADVVDLIDENSTLCPQIKLEGFLRCVIKYDVGQSEWGSSEARIYLQTETAFYALIMPSDEYRPFYALFYIPRRLAQAVIPAALSANTPTRRSFLDGLSTRVDPVLGSDMRMGTYSDKDIVTWSNTICDIIESHPRRDEMNTKFLGALFGRSFQASSSDTSRRKPASPQQPRLPDSRGNIDDMVLRKDRQQNTVVTPSVAALAKNFVYNSLRILGNHGSYTTEPSKAETKQHQEDTVLRIKELCHKILDNPKLDRERVIDYDKNERIPGELHRYPAITVNGERYQKGDCVLIPQDERKLWTQYIVQGELNIPADSRIDDFFWFARILYFDMSKKNPIAHVQWFQHGSRTILGELAHPQELFLLHWCDNLPVRQILGKVEVRFAPQGNKSIPKDAYFCKFVWDMTDSSFREIPEGQYGLTAELPPPYNCPVCLLDATKEEFQTPRLIKRGGQMGSAKGPKNIGVAIGDQAFHRHDFVTYKSTEHRAANIGKIVGIQLSGGAITVTVTRVGRISDLPKSVMKNLPHGTFKDERHLFLTDETETIPATALIELIHAPLVSQIPSVPYGGKLENWLDPCYDPNHFYIKWRFPNLKPKTTAGLVTLESDEPQCADCVQEKNRKDIELALFAGMKRQQPLRALDIFAGAGGLSQGLASGLNGCFKTTHAIEISPSACHTFKHNSPDAIVYNQCANTMLRYAIKTALGHDVEVPMTLESILNPDPNKTLVPVPAPPKPDDIDVIVAGFPCQTFSGLNQFRDASDVRANLVLNVLAWIDWVRPKYVILENVPGFLDQALAASPTSDHRTKGGIPNGYFKIMVQGMINMGYQIRYGLLDAAHYGTPQRRSRFISLASPIGVPLPKIPLPTHHFVSIKLGKLEKILEKVVPDYRTISTKANAQRGVPDTAGTALFNTVTIADAIGDLLFWDWAGPRPEEDRRSVKRQHRRDIPSVPCDRDAQFWGIGGVIEYESEPQTRFQKVVRADQDQVQDLQHVTRTFLPKVAERVCHIPLRPGANFTSLPERLQEFQTADPLSAVGRANYQHGPYSRPDANGVFQTTVTNVSPTAKQCWVLNPFCHRIFSVRELARSQGFHDDFLFIAIGGRIITMHRQIGNAVPIPLGHALGRSIRQSMLDQWVHARETAIVID